MLESAELGEFLSLGRPPFRIDMLQSISGLDDFQLARTQKSVVDVDGVAVDVIGLDDLLTAKAAAGRPQDIADIAHLKKLRAAD